MDLTGIKGLIETMPYFSNCSTDEKALKYIDNLNQQNSDKSNLASIFDPCHPSGVLVQVPYVDQLPASQPKPAKELNVVQFFTKLSIEIKTNRSTLEYLEAVQTGKPIQFVSTVEIPKLLQAVQVYYETGDDGHKEINGEKLYLVLDEGFSSYMIQILPLLYQRKSITVLCHPQCYLSVAFFTQLCHNAGQDQIDLATYCIDLAHIKTDEKYKLPKGNKIICSDLIKPDENSIIQPTTMPSIIVFDSTDIPSATDGVIEVYKNTAASFKTYQGVKLFLSENIEVQFRQILKHKLSKLERSVSLDYNCDIVVFPSPKGDEPIQKTEPIKMDSFNEKQVYGIDIIVFRSVKEGITLLNSSHGKFIGSVSVWTEKLTLALEASKLIKSNTIYINSQNFSDITIPSQARSDNLKCLRNGGKVYDEDFQQQTKMNLLPLTDSDMKDFRSIFEKSTKALKSWSAKKYKERAIVLRRLGGSFLKIYFKDQKEKENVEALIEYCSQDLDHIFTGRIVESASCKTILTYNEPKGVMEIIDNESLFDCYKDSIFNLAIGNTVIVRTSTHEKELKELFYQLQPDIFQVISVKDLTENKIKNMGDTKTKYSLKAEMDKYIALRSHCKHIWIPYGEIV